jgi:hypothetical protein
MDDCHAQGRRPYVAYKGNPLYTYANDKRPGDATNDGLGNVRHIAKQLCDGEEAAAHVASPPRRPSASQMFHECGKPVEANVLPSLSFAPRKAGGPS